MNEPLKISYHPWQKNKSRGTDTYYCRVHEKGCKPFDVNLNTTDKKVAEGWCALRVRELENYNMYIAAGQPVPEAIAAQIVRSSNRTPQKTQANAEKTVAELLEMFEMDVRKENLRQTSIDGYVRSLKAIFLRAPKGLETRMSELTVDKIDALIASYQTITRRRKAKVATDAEPKDQTKKNYATILRRFVLWYQKKFKKFDTDIVDAIKRVKCDAIQHKIWSFEQMMRICRWPTKDDTLETPKNIRAKHLALQCYWKILAELGPRGTELRKVRWEDFTHNEYGWKITLRAENTKGRRSRPLPIDASTADLLLMLHKFTEHNKKSDYMFADVPESISSRNALLKKACEEMNVPVGTMHQFRHSCAAYYFKEAPEGQRLDPKTLQSLLGHKSAATTMGIYMEITGEAELAEKVNASLDEAPSRISTMETPEISQLF